MTDSTLHRADPLTAAPLPPSVKLPYLQRIKLARSFHTGGEITRDLAGPVVDVPFGPGWLMPRLVFVTSPQGAHDVLAGFDGSVDKVGVAHVESRLWGKNLFNLPHEQWKPRRRAVQPLFTKRHVATYASHVTTVVDRLAADWVSRGDIDLDRETRRLTFQVLGRSVLGMDLGDRSDDLSRHFHRMLEYPQRRATQLLRLPAAVPTPSRASFRRSLHAIQAVADEAVERCRRDPDHDAPLVRQLMSAVDPDTGAGLKPSEIRDDLIVFMVAGHDTTATTLAHALWQLGRDPQMQQRAAEEALAIGDGPIVADDLALLPFTVQVIHEALRLFPPAAGLARFTVRDVVVDGFRVAQGTNIIVGTWALHRDPTLWDEPTRFDPSRFSPERSAGRDRWQYLPFGAGPRSCVGDHFAMLEAVIGLATVLRHVEISSRNDSFPVAVPFTLVAAEPIPVRATARRASPQLR